MSLKSIQLEKATRKQREKIERLLEEIDELSDGEGIGYINPDMPPEILIEFLESVIALEREFLVNRETPARASERSNGLRPIRQKGKSAEEI